MPMFIVLKDYLTQLTTLESRTPREKQRDVPTISELADSIGVHRVTLSNIANNKTTSLNLGLAGKIIEEMNRRGFPMTETDLIVYRKDE